MLFPRLTCEDLAELPGHLGLGRGAGHQGPLAADQMLLSLGTVEGLDEHLLLPKLDEANLPRKRKQTSVILARTCPGPAAEAGEATPPRPGPALGLQLCRVHKFMEPRNELVCETAVSCWGSGDGRQRLRHNSTHSLCSLSKIYYSICFFLKTY